MLYRTHAIAYSVVIAQAAQVFCGFYLSAALRKGFCRSEALWK
jgi:hypothetical protein